MVSSAAKPVEMAAGNEGLKKEITDLKNDNDGLRKKNDYLNTQMDNLKKQIDDLKVKNDDLSKTIAQLKEDNKSLKVRREIKIPLKFKLVSWQQEHYTSEV